MRWEEVEKPSCGPDDLIIKVKACGVCGTDVKTYHRGHPMFIPPVILGHEFSGDIVEIGNNIHKFSLGERVVVAPYVPCGKCKMCLLGQFELCSNKITSEGAFAEYVKISKEMADKGAFKIPDNMDYTMATLVEPLACCLNAADDCNYRPGDTVLIVGAGPMGLINLQVAKASAVSTVIIAETNPARRNLAEELGAIGVNPQSKDINKIVMDLTNGIGVDVVIIAIGIPQAAEQYLHLVRKGGRINLFGGFPKDSIIRTWWPFRPHGKIYNRKTLCIGS